VSRPDVAEPFSPSAPWSFHNPVRVRCGRDCRSGLADALRDTRLLIVTTKRGRRQLVEDRLLAGLLQHNRITWLDTVQPNPDLLWLEEARRALGQANFDAVLGFGGGSALDAAKVLAVGLSGECRQTSLMALLLDASLVAAAQPAPVHAVPTTAGTGSEVTPFATIWDHTAKKKHSLAGTALFPSFAWVDPALTDHVPAEITLSTGLDAINQAAESIWNKNANPVTLAFATRALQLGLSSLPMLLRQPRDSRLRDLMSEASLLAGLAISHTRTALCHSISYPLTAHFGLSHGLACAFSMLEVLRLAIEFDDGRLEYVGAALIGSATSKMQLIEYFETFTSQLEIGHRCRETLGTLEEVSMILPEMYTSERAANFVQDIDNPALLNIITKSFYQ